MPQFDADRSAMLARARDAGIETVLAIGSGTGPGSLDCAIQLANAAANQSSWPAIFATIGIHPHEAKLATDKDFAELAALAENKTIVAWGEIGLDYYYEHSPRDVQRNVFIRQLELANAARLPIIIHCRPSTHGDDAWDDCLTLLRQHWASSGHSGVMHCFTGSLAQAAASLDLGFMISFAGNVTFPKAQNSRDAAKQVPLDRILLETDAPFLAPVPHRGKRNEPAFVKETARQVAELRGLDVQEVAARTAENFYRFFHLDSKNPDDPPKVAQSDRPAR